MSYLSKEEAAKYLGCSTRHIERLTGSNRLGVRYKKVKGRDVPEYDQGELERFKADEERAVERPAVQVLGPQSQHSSPRPGTTGEGSGLSLSVADDEQMQALASHVLLALLSKVAQGSGVTPADSDKERRTGALALSPLVGEPLLGPGKPQVSPAEKVVLTIEEARSLTGFSRDYLRAAIGTGELKAQKIGRSLRIKRADLDAWVAGL